MILNYFKLEPFQRPLLEPTEGAEYAIFNHFSKYLFLASQKYTSDLQMSPLLMQKTFK